MLTEIALLRAINVGGHNLVTMEALRAAFETLGFTNVRTLLQSGNVVFERNASERPEAEHIESLLKSALNLGCRVVLRTPEELARLIEENPFPIGPQRPPNRLLVMFMAGPVVAKNPLEFARFTTAGEQLRIVGSHVFIDYVNGSGRSKLTGKVIEKELGVIGTARNWNTVTKLLAMARAR